MIDPPTWHETLDVDSWTPTGSVDVVLRIYERYNTIPDTAT